MFEFSCVTHITWWGRWAWWDWELSGWL